MQRTGSIMPGKRECHTRAKWRARDAAGAEDLNRARGAAGRDMLPSGRGS